MPGKKIVIIGGIAVGPKVASRVRRLDPEAEITIIEKNDLFSYAGCGLPYYLSGQVSDFKDLMSTPAGVIRDVQFFKNVKNVKVEARTFAEEIDRENKVVKAVRLDTGERVEYPYDKLVLATGGKPQVPDIEGNDLEGVFKLRSILDGLEIKKWVDGSGEGNVAIIGAGLIGLEMAEAFIEKGHRVVLVELEEHILPKTLDVETALLLQRYLASRGVEIYTSTRVLSIAGDSSGMVQSVTTDRGEITVSGVLLAAGVRSENRLAREAGLQIGKHGGVAVNDRMETSDPDIYAGGDTVEVKHVISGEDAYLPMGSTANKQGRVIGDNICGTASTFPGVLGTMVMKILDFTVAKTGLTEAEARRAGFETVTALNPAPDRAHYYPGAKPIFLKGIADKKTGRLIGFQGIGPGDVAKRLDIAVTAISAGMGVKEIFNLDLGYAPPYSNALDNIINLASILENKIEGVGRGISPLAVREMMSNGDDLLLLDVRSPAEYNEMRIKDERVMLVPLGKLRSVLSELPRDKKMVAFCKTSLRGYEASTILKGGGVKDVAFMDGGLIMWPFEVDRSPLLEK